METSENVQQDDRPRTRVPGIVLLVLLALLAGLWIAVGIPTRSPVPSPTPAPSPEVRPDPGPYIGRDYCMSCHLEPSATFRTSNMFRSLRPATPATVLGDFSPGTTLTHGAKTYSFSRDEERYRVSITGEDGGRRDFDVRLVLGRRFGQRLLVSTGEGLLSPFPVYWVVRERRWRHGAETGLDPEGEGVFSWDSLMRSHNIACFGCHAYRHEKEFDPDRGAWEMQYLDAGVGCEACHGPGGRHQDQNARGAGRIAERALEHVARPLELEGDASTALCVQCHSKRGVIRDGFGPGDDPFDFFTVVVEAGDLHPDGSPVAYMYQYLPFAQSGCVIEGGASCVTCHDPHGSEYPAQLRHDPATDTACLGCHAAMAEDPVAHSHHPEGPEGVRCVECHMRRIDIEFADHRSHLITVPVPRSTRRLGIPNACQDCHSEEGPAWAEEKARAWWGSYQDEAAVEGETMAAAEKGDPAAIARLRTWIRGGEGGGISRAHALTRLAQRPLEELGPLLEAALQDESAIVRMTAAHLTSLHLAYPGTSPQEDALCVRLMMTLEDPVRGPRRLAIGALSRRPDLKLKDLPAVRRVIGDLSREWPFVQDDPFALLEMALIHRRTGQDHEADSIFERILALLRLDPQLVGPMAVRLDLAAEDGWVWAALESPGEEPSSIRVRWAGPIPRGGRLFLGLGLADGPSGRIHKVRSVSLDQGSGRMEGLPGGRFRVRGFWDLDGDGRYRPGTDRGVESSTQIRLPGEGRSVDLRATPHPGGSPDTMAPRSPGRSP